MTQDRLASIDVRIERIDGRLTLIQVLLALLVAGVASLMLRAFL